jgi:hypothetical protein
MGLTGIPTRATGFGRPPQVAKVRHGYDNQEKTQIHMGFSRPYAARRETLA